MYRWESKWRDWNKTNTTLKVCRAYINTACAHYGVSPPKVKGHLGHGYSWCQAGKKGVTISLNKKHGLNVATALHEAAHAIATDLLPLDMADHEPRFVGIYLWLLTKAKIAPRIALEASLREAGVEWDKHTTPRYLKKKSPS